MDSCQYVICTITFGVISFFSLPVSFNKLEFGSWNYFLSGYSICKVNFGCIVGELSLAESPTAAMSFGCDCIVKPGRLQLSIMWNLVASVQLDAVLVETWVHVTRLTSVGSNLQPGSSIKDYRFELH